MLQRPQVQLVALMLLAALVGNVVAIVGAGLSARPTLRSLATSSLNQKKGRDIGAAEYLIGSSLTAVDLVGLTRIELMFAVGGRRGWGRSGARTR